MYQPAKVYLAWAPASGGNIPRNAVVGGRDNTAREDLFIGRVILGNEAVPGKVVRSHNVLYIAYNGKEIPHSNYEVLVSDVPDRLKWLPDANGRNPEHSVQGGHAQDGEPMYIARAQAPDGGVCVGKLHRSHGCCYIPWGGQEHAVKSYEVLTFP